ncbi:reverse transcriptase/maturase family protein [Flavobacterium sp. Fl-318]|uniref:Reverse transcriptase/maturase family protein n=1 Tax=Flavobacterium cupriresistens TaxID=2893885 RepID=A0ABU4R784_9FLAO|nr:MULTISPECIES: reverse transcriptase/maturase family protein [unclassified Flavobacterium]MDX6187893.1 reverse transcriptase/maturase family protein [Flavobacterium sp. Fl-318]UFH42187.1 reverse transcriptase/maturase family protein [Flavobacterium sp. F-323]
MYSLNQHQEELLKSVTVKIAATFKKETKKTLGTGILYKTSKKSKINYVFTALHCVFGKRLKEDFPDKNSVHEIEINQQDENGDFKLLGKISTDKIIPIYEYDIAILLIDFNIDDCKEFILGNINNNRYFDSYGYPNFANGNAQNFSFKRKVNPVKSKDLNIECLSNVYAENSHEKISGFSGSGLFYRNRSVLVGLITEITDESGFANSFTAKKMEAKLLNYYIEKYDSALEKIRSTDEIQKIGINQDGSLINYESIVVNGIELNIWRAFKRLRNDLRDDWFQDPLNFKFILSKKFFLERINESLNSLEKVYVPTAIAKHFTIPKSGYSTRPSIEVSFIDRIIYQAYVDILAENLDISLDNKVYSFRYNSGKGSATYMYHYSIEQWKKYIYQTKFVLNNDKPFLVVADITNFFENINIKTLIDYIKELIHDYDNYTLEKKNNLYKIVENLKQLVVKWNDKLVNSEFGIPQNRDASSFLANLFLNKLDNTMIDSNRHSYYYRYMDDIRIVCQTKSEAIKAIYDLSVAMRDLGLNLNSSKTKILDYREDVFTIDEYLPESLIEIEQINSLLSTKRRRDVQKAVYITFRLFKSTINNKSDEDYLKRRKLGFCIEKLQQFARTPGLKDIINFKEVVDYVLNELENQPWLTTNFIKLLRAIDKTYYKRENFEVLEDIILDKYKNIYQGQTYYLWMFLSYNNFVSQRLITYAANIIKNTNQENQADTAGAFLYLASVDWRRYKTIMLKSINNGNLAENYFLQRNALIALRMVNPSEIRDENILGDLKDFHQKLYKEQKEVFVSDLPSLKYSNIIRDTPNLISL